MSSAATPNERSTDALHMQDDGAARVLPVPPQEVASAANKFGPDRRDRGAGFVPASASSASDKRSGTSSGPSSASNSLLHGSSAASTDQLELVPTPRCDHCGHLAWTLERFGRLTHKCACPHRRDPFCQAHPRGCDDFTDIRNEAWRKSYQISELRGETWEDAFGGAA